MKKIKSIILSILAIIILITIGIIAINIAPTIKRVIYDLNILNQIKETINSFKILGVVIIFLLQFIQVFLVIIPAEPIELITGMSYGGLLGFILCFISTTIATLLIFIITKKYKSKTILKIYNKCEKQFKSLQKSQNIEVLVFIIYLVPGLPKEFFSYFASFTNISLKNFLIITSIARIPSITVSTIVGASLINGNIELPIMLFILMSIISIVGIYFYKKNCKKVDKKAY